MNKLTLTPNFGPDPSGGADAFYAELIAAQADLSDEAAADWLARLTLILCNHIGDRDVLREALALARDSQFALARDSQSSDGRPSP